MCNKEEALCDANLLYASAYKARKALFHIEITRILTEKSPSNYFSNARIMCEEGKKTIVDSECLQWGMKSSVKISKRLANSEYFRVKFNITLERY